MHLMHGKIPQECMDTVMKRFTCCL